MCWERMRKFRELLHIRKWDNLPNTDEEKMTTAATRPSRPHMVRFAENQLPYQLSEPPMCHCVRLGGIS